MSWVCSLNSATLGLYQGFEVGYDSTNTSILQFADDTTLFYDYDDSMLDVLINTLRFLKWSSERRESVVEISHMWCKCQSLNLIFLLRRSSIVSSDGCI